MNASIGNALRRPLRSAATSSALVNAILRLRVAGTGAIARLILILYLCFIVVLWRTPQPQHNHDTTTTQPQHNRNTTTTQQHHNHNTTTTQPQHNHNTTTTQPQHNRNTTVQLLCCCCVVVVLWLWCCCGFCGRWPFYATVRYTF